MSANGTKGEKYERWGAKVYTCILGHFTTCNDYDQHEAIQYSLPRVLRDLHGKCGDHQCPLTSLSAAIVAVHRLSSKICQKSPSGLMAEVWG